MRIKDLSKIKELIKSKLPEYLEELGCESIGGKISCPHVEAHEHGDKEKLSAAFLPDSNNKLIYCFVEQRQFDIFDVYALKTGKSTKGSAFYDMVKELAEKYGIPVDEEYEYSEKEKASFRQRKFLENLHKLSCTSPNPKKGIPFYKLRGLNTEKIKDWRIGYLSPNDITPELNKECKSLFDYRLLQVFHKPGLVIPILDDNKQYTGVIIRMFNTNDENPYIKICIKGSNLFNIERVRGNDSLTIVEGVFDAIALHPEQNVVACLTNAVNDVNLEKIADMKMKRIKLALDPDNLYKGSARDGFLRTILRMKNLDTEVSVVKVPQKEGEDKADPDEYMKTHTLKEFNELPQIDAIDYLLQNHKKELINESVIYDFIAGCPNLIRKEKYITECAKILGIGKRQLTHSIEDMSDNKTSFNLIQYVQEKDSYDELLEGFTELAWNKKFSGIQSGFPLFDKKFGGFEDTLYLFIGHPESGKCWKKGTPIIMSDGSIKNVEDIKIGDYVMGENSKPILVTSTCVGEEEMFDIVPNRGDTWGCNKSHILVLNYHNGPNKVIELSVEEFLQKSKAFQFRCKLIQQGIDLPEQPVNYDPYFIGAWLGDGSVNKTEITNPDLELIPYFKEFCKKYNLTYYQHNYQNRCLSHTFNNGSGKPNPLRTELKHCYIKGEKRIPKNYLLNSKDNRLKLLAGLLDTDGFYTDKGYEIITKYSGLKDDILYLSRSLGLRANYSKKFVKAYPNNDYYRIGIDGDCTQIPCLIKRKQAEKRISRRNHLMTGFKVIPKGVGTYYGFTLDSKSNGRCLLGNFVLTHNSATLLNFVYNLVQNDDTFVAFYSLDDGAKRSIIPRLMSIAANLSSKKIRQPDHQMKKEWFDGMKKMQTLKENLVIKDGSDIRTIDDLDNFVKIHSTIANERRKRFVLVIDNVHDLNSGARRDLEATQNSQRVAGYLKRLPQIMNCPIIATAEVPKSASPKPTGQDIKESCDWWYASRFVAGIYSNFHQAKNKRDTVLHWNDSEGKFHPIIEMFVSKNQTGEAEHGSLFYKFNFNNNTLIECDERETEALSNGQMIGFLE